MTLACGEGEGVECSGFQGEREMLLAAAIDCRLASALRSSSIVFGWTPFPSAIISLLDFSVEARPS